MDNADQKRLANAQITRRIVFHSAAMMSVNDAPTVHRSAGSTQGFPAFVQPYALHRKGDTWRSRHSDVDTIMRILLHVRWNRNEDCVRDAYIRLWLIHRRRSARSPDRNPPVVWTQGHEQAERSPVRALTADSVDSRSGKVDDLLYNRYRSAGLSFI